MPAALVAGIYGLSGTAKLLIFSQVILSLQLPFAVVPLVKFTSNARVMGAHVNPLWLKVSGYAIAAVIISLNLALLCCCYPPADVGRVQTQYVRSWLRCPFPQTLPRQMRFAYRQNRSS